jgi:hypothetical protein
MQRRIKLIGLGIAAAIGLAGCAAYPVGPDTYAYAPAPYYAAPYYTAPYATGSIYYYDGPRYYGPRRYYGSRYHGPRHYYGGGRHYSHGRHWR